VFRNVLIVCGAAWLSHLIMSYFRGIILLVVFGEKVPETWSAVAAYAWASGTVIIFAVLYGGIVGATLPVTRLGWWPLCLAVVAWLGVPSSFGLRSFPSAFSLALAENVASAGAAVVALISFVVTRNRIRQGPAVANAR